MGRVDGDCVPVILVVRLCDQDCLKGWSPLFTWSGYRFRLPECLLIVRLADYGAVSVPAQFDQRQSCRSAFAFEETHDSAVASKRQRMSAIAVSWRAFTCRA